jgi:hypothetical protein
MDLFSTGLDENQNLLPKDGTVFYYGYMMPLRMPILLSGKLLESLEKR